MVPSLHALLAQVLDYAGLFPPAQLPLDEALRHYVHYRNEPEGWMLGRFIVPTEHLANLAEAHARLTPPAPPLHLVAVGRRSGPTLKDALTALRDDLEALLAFRNEQSSAGTVDVYEMRLPPELLGVDGARELRAIVYGPDRMLAGNSAEAPAGFYELAAGEEWFSSVGILLGALVEDPERRKGLKVRCGGQDAAAVPSPEDLAFALGACRETRVPLKFTAGLHHPFRRFDATLKTHTHGFLNLLVAGTLGHAHQLALEPIHEILVDEDAGHFAFEEDGLYWKDLRAAPDQIVVARRDLVTSFGSCAFEEPCDDLAARGWL